MQFAEINIKKIRITGDNPRIINKKSQDFRELVESVKATGVKVPIHVRDNGEGCELLAGERRLLAAGEAKLKTIPALNHGRISDEAAFEIMFTENYARADLTILEQGKAVATLFDKYKGDTAAVASKLGKTVKWVLQQRAIYENLSPKWRKAITTGERYKDWTAGHLQLVAAMPSNIQNELLDEYHYRTPTVKQLEHDLNSIMQLLSAAPWDKDDPKLVKEAGACNKCDKRSSCRPGLFDDETDEETVKKNDRCLDVKCWNKKAKSHVALKAAELKSQHKNLIYAVSPDKHVDYNTRADLEKQFGDVAYQWKSARENEKGAVPALIVHGKQAGELRWVKFPQTRVGTKAKTGEVKKPTPLKERRKLLEKKRWFVVIRNLIEKVEKCGVDTIVSKDRIFTVMALTATFGTTLDYGWRVKGEWRNFDKIKTKNNALDKLWIAVRKTICDNLTYCGPITQTPNELIESAKRMAKLLGINIKAMFKEASEKEYPEPKTWANLKEDGTPKEKSKSKSKKTKKNSK